MSGYKHSAYEIEQQRQERLDLEDGIRALGAEAGDLKIDIERLLGEASEGLLTTFVQEAEAARQWSGDRVGAHRPTIRPTTTTPVVRDTHGSMEALVTEGRRAHRALSLALTSTADVLGRELAEALADVESSYLSRRALLGQWFGEAEQAAWEGRLHLARRDLADERYGELGLELHEIAAALSRRVGQADTMETAHQRRLYVFSALKDVCATLHFRTVSEPEPGSMEARGRQPLQLTVDTLDRGLIAFTLTLEGIETESGVEGSHCVSEFGALSEQLEQEFGVATRFTARDPVAPRTGRTREVLEQPRATTSHAP